MTPGMILRLFSPIPPCQIWLLLLITTHRSGSTLVRKAIGDDADPLS